MPTPAIYPSAVRTRALAASLSTALLAGVLFFAVGCSDSNGDSAATVQDPGATGTELVNQYIALLKAKDTDGLRRFISDAFIIQRADGSHSQKAAYLENFPEIGDYSITDVSALQADSSLIVRWFLTVDEVIDGRRYSGEPAPRLSTFVYQGGEWRLSSHANFNAPTNATPPASPTTTGN